MGSSSSESGPEGRGVIKSALPMGLMGFIVTQIAYFTVNNVEMFNAEVL
jgi:hypothetical protein